MYTNICEEIVHKCSNEKAQYNLIDNVLSVAPFWDVFAHIHQSIQPGPEPLKD